MITQEILFNQLKSNYSSNSIKKVDSDAIYLFIENLNYNVRISFRVQFNTLVSFYGFSILLNKVEFFFPLLIIAELEDYYSNDERLVIGNKEFYKTNYEFVQEIKDETHLEEYLDEVIKCITFHEQEVFPKLLDVVFLAEYVGSVSFENKAKVVVGGSFPVHLFKKMAILLWGNHIRYEEYKEGTQLLIEKYAIKKPENYSPAFRLGFDYLVDKLENEPNPFEIEPSLS